MTQQVSAGPTQKVIAAAVASPVGAYFSTLVVYVLNGVAFHCWTDAATAAQASSATAAAWTCVAHLPDGVTTAIEGLITALFTLGAGWLMPPSPGDHITE